MPHKTREGYNEWMRRYRAKNYEPGVAVAPKYHIALDTVKPLDIRVPKHGLKIAWIPDTQIMDGVPLDHLRWAGQYIARKRPDVIVHAGDLGDFPSLSAHSRAIEREGMRYRKDVDAVRRGLDLLMAPVERAAGYHPRKVITLGNHEDHIDRYVREHPEQEGNMSLADIGLKDYGWEEVPFLQPVSIGGVAFCHYFPSGVMGRPISTAAALVRKLHMSACAGHIQGREIHYDRRADGSHMTAIISGSFYQHRYQYLSPFTNSHWRGMWMLHEVHDGRFDEMALSLSYLKRRFG